MSPKQVQDQLRSYEDRHPDLEPKRENLFWPFAKLGWFGKFGFVCLMVATCVGFLRYYYLFEAHSTKQSVILDSVEWAAYVASLPLVVWGMDKCRLLLCVTWRFILKRINELSRAVQGKGE